MPVLLDPTSEILICVICGERFNSVQNNFKKNKPYVLCESCEYDFGLNEL